MSRKLESTPPIRNSNIVSSSPNDFNFLEDQLNLRYDAGDLFVPKKISSNRIMNDLNLSHSGPLSSGLINTSGRHMKDQRNQAQFAGKSGQRNMAEMPERAVNLQNQYQADFRATVPGGYAPVGEPKPFFGNSQNFPLVIPNYNQVQYFQPQTNTLQRPHPMGPGFVNVAPEHVPRQMGHQFEHYQMNAPPGKLMTFLHPRGSLFQRQYESKVFGNRPAQPQNLSGFVGNVGHFQMQNQVQNNPIETQKNKANPKGKEKKNKRKRRRKNKNKGQKKPKNDAKNSNQKNQAEQNNKRETANKPQPKKKKYYQGNYWDEDYEEEEGRYSRRAKKYPRRKR